MHSRSSGRIESTPIAECIFAAGLRYFTDDFIRTAAAATVATVNKNHMAAR
jgi:hypothetical protein